MGLYRSDDLERKIVEPLRISIDYPYDFSCQCVEPLIELPPPPCWHIL